MNITNNNYFVGLGRNKTSIARVYLKKGTGQSQVRTKQKNATAQKIQAEIVELEKSLLSLNQVLANQKMTERINQTSSVTKSEMKEKLAELKKRLRQGKKN
jgi:ribosomal protein S9